MISDTGSQPARARDSVSYLPTPDHDQLAPDGDAAARPASQVEPGDLPLALHVDEVEDDVLGLAALDLGALQRVEGEVGQHQGGTAGVPLADLLQPLELVVAEPR